MEEDKVVDKVVGMEANMAEVVDMVASILVVDKAAGMVVDMAVDTVVGMEPDRSIADRLSAVVVCNTEVADKLLAVGMALACNKMVAVDNMVVDSMVLAHTI